MTARSEAATVDDRVAVAQHKATHPGHFPQLLQVVGSPFRVWCAQCARKQPGLDLVIAVPPSLNHAYTIGRGHLYKTRAAKEWCASVGLRAQLAHPKVARPWFPGGDVAVTVVWHRKYEMGDIDNLLKLTLDSLQGVAYRNDHQVALLELRRTADLIAAWPQGCLSLHITAVL